MTTQIMTIDQVNSKASFTVKKLGLLTVKGTLADMSGEISFDENDLKNSSFHVKVQAATIQTGNPKRDEHLKTEDFFDVQTYPTLTFTSTNIEGANGHYKAIGPLTMLETSKKVEIPFEFRDGMFTGQFSLDRTTYGLVAKIPTLVVGKKIEVAIACRV
ncbi:MAG: YceI family protein [Bacteroidota bacterium]